MNTLASSPGIKLATEKDQGEKYNELTILNSLFPSWTGYTSNYTRVAAKSDEDLTNEIRSVTLEEVRGDLVLGKLAQSPS